MVKVVNFILPSLYPNKKRIRIEQGGVSQTGTGRERKWEGSLLPFTSCLSEK